jgi:hypothetical protein
LDNANWRLRRKYVKICCSRVAAQLMPRLMFRPSLRYLASNDSIVMAVEIGQHGPEVGML